ncbi:ATP-binding protein [Streptomyces sp. ACA25]|uniref:ATP-binding protein n=1 Tax=Streptomyces sp. ACA25 TaxID=3022596 RepID=UPI002307D8A6|nr:ATP-binding protein [Streptomyces sp. ACA25]MDB1086732.1 ATP-binding protein [Streptomyces sp. ACA25]
MQASPQAASQKVTTRRLCVRPDQVAVARGLVARQLVLWGQPGLVDSAVLIVSELATNVVRHAGGAGGTFALTLRLETGALVVEVSDCGRQGRPEPREAGTEEESGRGLALVGALAQTWGVRTGQGGRTVWVRLATEAGETCGC